MDWIPSLLKHLSISRAAVVAIFFTAVVLHGGPRLAPEHFDVVPAPWSVLVQAALVFSGFLTLFWAWGYTAGQVSKAFRKLVQLYRSKNLNEAEMVLLHGMGQKPSESLNIDRIDFLNGNFPWSELELLNILKNLKVKGLVSQNPFASNLFSLTDRGREKALEITRSSTTDHDEG